MMVSPISRVSPWLLKTVATHDFPFGFSVGGAAVKVSPGRAMSSGLDQKLGVTTRLASGELDCEPAELVEVADADDDDVARSLTFPAQITGVREAKVFKTSVRGGRPHLIVQIPAGEITFYVSSNADWISAIRTVGSGQPT